MNSNIKFLSLSAARLLLAYLAQTDSDRPEDAVLSAGTDSYHLILKSRTQLQELGFLLDVGTEDERVTLMPQQSAAERQTCRKRRKPSYISAVDQMALDCFSLTSLDLGE